MNEENSLWKDISALKILLKNILKMLYNVLKLLSLKLSLNIASLGSSNLFGVCSSYSYSDHLIACFILNCSVIFQLVFIIYQQLFFTYT